VNITFYHADKHDNSNISDKGETNDTSHNYRHTSL